MKISLPVLSTICGLLFAMLAAEPLSAAETIVMVRHAEKPEGGLGQLSCQGLNRSLALPKVLLAKFGTPAAIFAPDPGVEKIDQGLSYNYIRPLATIEPTAIRVGLPVDTRWGFEEIPSLKIDLLGDEYKNSTVFVAWEHRLLEQLARDILDQLGGDAATVPPWDGSDFDSIYIIRITQDGNGDKTATFHADHQNLNKLDVHCPGE
jgi:hypothetical protein